VWYSPVVIMATYFHRKWLTIVARAFAEADKDGTTLKNVGYLSGSDGGPCCEDTLY
jgi:hypothetical protein